MDLEQEAMFSLSKVQFEWKGNLVDMAVHNNILLMAVQQRVLRIDLAKPAHVEVIDVITNGSDAIKRVFVDFSGKHAIITTKQGDNYYLHATWKRPKLLSKLRNFQIAAIAWCRNTNAFMRRSGVNSAASGPLLVAGVNISAIYEIELDPTEEFFRREERYCKLVYNGFGTDQKITGITYDLVYEEQFRKEYAILVSTQNRLYQFRGTIVNMDAMSPCFESVFLEYINNPSKVQNQELPGEFQNAELRLQYALDEGVVGVMKSFAWLTAPGVYYGLIERTDGEESVIHKAQLLPYPAQVDEKTQQFLVPSPVSMAPTQNHFIIVYEDRMKAICRLNDEIVWDQPFGSDMRDPLRISFDDVKGTYWVFNQTTLYEVVVNQEDRNIWMLYLSKNQFSLAYEAAKYQWQRDKVNIVQADYYYSQKRYLLAAKYYAESSMSVEQASLKFLVEQTADMLEALKTYLTIKLKLMSMVKDDIQKTLLTTWLFDLFLQEIDSSKSEDSKNKFKEWVQTPSVKACLDKKTIYQIFKNYDCREELIFFAKAMGDFEFVVDLCIQEHKFLEALEYLSKKQQTQVIYKHAPMLMANAPVETVSLFMKYESIDPKQLIPALIKYEPSKHGHDDSSAERQNQVLKYLEYCVYIKKSSDVSIHNMILQHYVIKPLNFQGEDVLSRYLRRPEKNFDLQHGLRLCTQYKRIHACILIYGSLAMYEDAVSLALQYDDLEIAQTYADQSDDVIARRRLWIKVCQYIIEQKVDIKQALSIVKESDLLNLEDVLPYFPDNILIGEFKEEFCDALDSYKVSVEQLQVEMDGAAKNAQSLRQKLKQAKHHHISVAASAKCAICNKPLLSNPFYAFPCSHVIHSPCLVAELLENHFTPKVRQLLISLQEQVSRGEKQAQQKLDELISADCPLCGEIMVKTIDKPFNMDQVQWLKR